MIDAVRARPIEKLRAVFPLFTILKTTGPTGTLLGVIVDCDSVSLTTTVAAAA